MSTLAITKAGYIKGVIDASFATARTSNGATAVHYPAASTPAAIQYVASTTQSGIVFNMIRTFLYFNTTNITGAVSNVSLEMSGDTNSSADVIVLKSTAYGGNGATTLATSDFYSTVNYTTPYSSNYTTWGPQVSIPLNSTAKADIQSNNEFICVIVEFYRDYSNSAGTSAASKINGITFSKAINLVYTCPTCAPSITLNSVGYGNIDKWDGTSWSNISKINGVS